MKNTIKLLSLNTLLFQSFIHFWKLFQKCDLFHYCHCKNYSKNIFYPSQSTADIFLALLVLFKTMNTVQCSLSKCNDSIAELTVFYRFVIDFYEVALFSSIAKST